MHRIAFTILVPLLVSACAGGPYGYGSSPGAAPPVSVGPSSIEPSPLARSITYTCEDLTTIVLTEGQPTAQVTMNSGLVLSLARQGGLGARYGAPPYEFRTGGAEATLFNNNRAVRCRAK